MPSSVNSTSSLGDSDLESESNIPAPAVSNQMDTNDLLELIKQHREGLEAHYGELKHFLAASSEELESSYDVLIKSNVLQNLHPFTSILERCALWGEVQHVGFLLKHCKWNKEQLVGAYKAIHGFKASHMAIINQLLEAPVVLRHAIRENSPPDRSMIMAFINKKLEDFDAYKEEYKRTNPDQHLNSFKRSAEDLTYYFILEYLVSCNDRTHDVYFNELSSMNSIRIWIRDFKFELLDKARSVNNEFAIKNLSQFQARENKVAGQLGVLFKMLNDPKFRRIPSATTQPNEGNSSSSPAEHSHSSIR